MDLSGPRRLGRIGIVRDLLDGEGGGLGAGGSGARVAVSVTSPSTSKLIATLTASFNG